MITLSQPITSERPVLQTTTVPETFTGLWISSLVVSSSPTGKTNAEVDLLPFNPDNGAVDNSRRRRLRLNDLFQLAAERPTTLGVALQSLLSSINALAEEHGAVAPDCPRIIVIKPTPPPPAEPEPEV